VNEVGEALRKREGNFGSVGVSASPSMEPTTPFDGRCSTTSQIRRVVCTISGIGSIIGSGIHQSGRYTHSACRIRGSKIPKPGVRGGGKVFRNSNSQGQLSIKTVIATRIVDIQVGSEQSRLVGGRLKINFGTYGGVIVIIGASGDIHLTRTAAITEIELDGSGRG